MTLHGSPFHRPALLDCSAATHGTPRSRQVLAWRGARHASNKFAKSFGGLPNNFVVFYEWPRAQSRQFLAPCAGPPSRSILADQSPVAELGFLRLATPFSERALIGESIACEPARARANETEPAAGSTGAPEIETAKPRASAVPHRRRRSPKGGLTLHLLVVLAPPGSRANARERQS